MYRITDYKVESIENNIDYFIPQSIINTNCQYLWDKNYLGQGIHIAVLDTGCDINHKCLSDRIVETKNFINGSEDVTDDNGHGTHVAGIIASNRVKQGMTGIAPESLLHIYKVLNAEGSGSIENINKAIEYAINKKVDIISMSLGGSYADETMHNLIIKANELGICVVCASGNDANNDDGSIDEYSYPSAFQESIEVGSLDPNDTMSYFSNSNNNLDICTYGGSITSCYPNNRYAKCSGTSQATPLVSGALALLKQKFKDEFGRNADEEELYSQLIKNTKTIPKVNRKLQGNGMLRFVEGE